MSPAQDRGERGAHHRLGAHEHAVQPLHDESDCRVRDHGHRQAHPQQHLGRLDAVAVRLPFRHDHVEPLAPLLRRLQHTLRDVTTYDMVILDECRSLCSILDSSTLEKNDPEASIRILSALVRR